MLVVGTSGNVCIHEFSEPWRAKDAGEQAVGREQSLTHKVL